MSHSSFDREPLEALAEEFQDRHRRGEKPSIEEYAEKNPDLADEIRDLFPALVAMEVLKPGSDSGDDLTTSTDSRQPTIERLGDFRILREVEKGKSIVGICRLHGLSKATFYRRQALYGGMKSPGRNAIMNPGKKTGA